MSGRTPVLLCWSGGKDCYMALQALRRSADVKVTGLLTTVTAEDARIGMHGVRAALLEQQAAALGLPLEQIRIPAFPSNDAYETAMGAALLRHVAVGTRTVAFGDLFLEDIRAYREQWLGRLGLRAIFPVWGRDTRAFALDVIASGCRAILVCIDSAKLDAAFAGRAFDEGLLADLPPRVDPCGENGEFHSFVFDGPGFAQPIAFERGARSERNGFVYRDLVPTALDTPARA